MKRGLNKSPLRFSQYSLCFPGFSSRIVLFLREIFLFNDLYRHFFTCPQFEGSSSLVQQHVHSITSLASCFFCFTKKSCLLRIINYIKYKQIFVEHACICDDRSVYVRCHTNRSTIYKNCTLCDRCTQNFRIRKIMKRYFTLCALI